KSRYARQEEDGALDTRREDGKKRHDVFCCVCSAAAVMGGSSVNQQLERVGRSYALEGSVRVWSDFLRLHLHPRTVSVIHQYNHDGEAHRLEAFGQGLPLLQGSVLEDLEDRLHFFTEECDHLQGFQVLCDMTNGFSGLGSKVTELLHDSYSGKGILTWGMAPVTHPNATPMQDLYHVINTALGIVHMANHSSFFCPLTLRGGLGRRPGAPNSVPLWQMADLLTDSGRKVVAAYGAVPLPVMQGSTLPDALSHYADALPWRPLSTRVGPDSRAPLHSLRSGEDVLASYISSFYPTGTLAMNLLSAPSKLTAPFPQIFSPDLDTQGWLRSRDLPPGSRRGGTQHPPRGPQLPGPEMAEYQEALEELRLLARCYRDDSRRGGAHFSSSGEDEDSDD
ncbi:LOW QUALITY PROTEIN: hypothetical protein CRUP_001390, partial [Coryphaenoides rupestris]